MDIDQIRAEGHAVKAGELTREQAAFKPCVDGFDLRSLAGLLGIDGSELVAQRRFAPLFPRGIGSRHVKRAAQQL